MDDTKNWIRRLLSIRSLSVRARLLTLSAGLFGAFAAGLLLHNMLFERIREDEALAEEQYRHFELILTVEQSVSLYRHQNGQLNSAVMAKDQIRETDARVLVQAARTQLNSSLSELAAFDAETRAIVATNVSEAPQYFEIFMRALSEGRSEDASAAVAEVQHRFNLIEDALEKARKRELILTRRIQKQSSERASNAQQVRVAITVVIIVSGGLLMITIQRSILRPLQITTEAMRQVNSGEVTIEMPPERRDEFGDMAQAIRHFRDRSEKLHRMAYYDPLTGLGNRPKLEDSLSLALSGSPRDNGNVALLYLDLDNFRSVNQRLGHRLGDRYLVEAVHRLHRFIPDDASLFRYSGDKFVVLLTIPTARSNAENELKAIAGFVLRGIAEPYPILNDVLNMSTSIGMAISPEDGTTAEQLISSAEAAVFAAKKSGRNIALFAGGKLSGQLRQQKALANEIRRGLQENQFAVFYQPIVDARFGKVTGAEALTRWRHPERGLLAASQFINVAEEEGLIGHMSQNCLESVHLQADIWKTAGHDWRIAVNLSARQMQDSGIVEKLAALRTSPDSGSNVVDLELTETALFDTSDEARQLLTAIRQLGYRIGMDDFGTGYSSFNYLQWLPIDKIKIDRQFVGTMEVSRQAKGIISAVIALAQYLDLEVVAEGVETASQASALLKLGCHLHQGYHYAPALTPEDFELWTRQFFERNVRGGGNNVVS